MDSLHVYLGSYGSWYGSEEWVAFNFLQQMTHINTAPQVQGFACSVVYLIVSKFWSSFGVPDN